MTRWFKAASVVLAAGATAGGLPLLAQKETAVLAPQSKPNANAARADDTPVHEVKSGKLSIIVEEGGFLEATRTHDVFCQLEGQTAILSIVPEGTRVTKGQLVCELDSAALKVQLTNQYIATSGAEAAYQNAKLTREVAEIAVTEYTEGIYLQELQTVKAEIAAAQTAIQKAEERMDRTLHARKWLKELLAEKKENRTVGEVFADFDIDDRFEVAMQTLAREKNALELAKTKQIVLEKFTREIKTKELRSHVEKAKSGCLGTEWTWDLEKRKQTKLEAQIKNCRLVAPGDGVVVYANSRSRFGASSPPPDRRGGGRSRTAENLKHRRSERPDAGSCQNPRLGHRVGHAWALGPDQTRRGRGQDPGGNGREGRTPPRSILVLSPQCQVLHGARRHRGWSRRPDPRNDGRGRDSHPRARRRSLSPRPVRGLYDRKDHVAVRIPTAGSSGAG